MAGRVLHLSSEHGWRGGERQLWLLARGLSQHRLPQAVAAPAGSPLAERVAALGIPVVRLAHGRSGAAADLLRLVREARRHPGTILHSHTSPTLSMAVLARRLAPVLAVVHTRRVAFPVRPSAKYRTAADRYVAISGAVAEGLRAGGLEAARLAVVPSGVDLAPIDAARPTPELAGRPGPFVACVGELTPEKGHGILLRAWRTVADRFPAAELVVVGDGPQRAALETLAAVTPGRVRFAGRREDVPAWLLACDLYVQPSLAEGLGTAALEAMGARLAVVATSAGGLREVVADGESGLLVPPGEPPALADALSALLADPARRRTMGEAGRRRVAERFTVPAMVGAYLELYRGLVLRRASA